MRGDVSYMKDAYKLENSYSGSIKFKQRYHKMEDTMKKTKLNRNLWLFSGLIWTFSLIRGLSIKGPSLYLLVNAVTAILCFISAYTQHKRIDKDNT